MAKTCSSPFGVVAIVGGDALLRREAIGQRMSAWPGGRDPHGWTRVSGESAELAEVLDEVRTPSLLSAFRIVVVDDADDFISRNREAVEKYCSAPSETGCLVLVCDSLPKSTRLHKILASKDSVVVCEAPRGRALVGWIQHRAKEQYGKVVGGAVAERLMDYLGDSTGSLDSELSKLAAYIGERNEITVADVGELTGQRREEKVFAVMDAMASGDAATALRHWEQVLATDRSAPARAVAGLAWSVRQLLQAQRQHRAGEADLWSLARRMFTDPAVLERRLKNLDEKKLREMQKDLLEIDVATKTGAATVETAVECFIVKHASNSGSAGSPRLASASR